jgi:hypothetical protein
MPEALIFILVIVALIGGIYAGIEYNRYSTVIGCTKVTFQEGDSAEEKYDTVADYLSTQLKGAKIYMIKLDTGDRFIEDDCMENYRKAKAAVIHFSARKEASNA